MHRTTDPRPARSEATQLAARAGRVLAFLGVLFAAVFAAGYAEINLITSTWNILTNPLSYLLAGVVALLWRHRGLFRAVQHG